MMRRVTIWIAGALSLALVTACGPEARVHVGVRDRAVNIRLGDQSPSPAPVIKVPTTGIGFISPPVRFDFPKFPQPSPPPPEACPKAGPGSFPEAEAPTSVKKGPKPGVYLFRRSGTLVIGNAGETEEEVAKHAPLELSPVIRVEVKNVDEQPVPELTDQPRITFDVVQTETGVVTTTSYLIDPVGTPLDSRTSAGLKITKIVVERADLPGSGPAGAGTDSGIETFTPNPPIKIMNLPAANEPDPIDATTSSRGVDAASGASMEAFTATKRRTTVDVCGRVIQAWRVGVSFKDAAGAELNSTYVRPEVRSYEFTGSFVFAPQFGMIVQQDFVFRGLDVGDRPYQLQTSATINSLDPA